MKYIKIACLLLCGLFCFFQEMFGCERSVVPALGHDVINKIETLSAENSRISGDRLLLVIEEKQDEVKAFIQTVHAEFPLTKEDANKILEKCDMNDEVSRFCCSFNIIESFPLGPQKLHVAKHHALALQRYVSQPAPVHVQQQEEFSEDVIDKIEFFSAEIKNFKMVHLITTEEGEPKLHFPLTKKEFPLTRVDANRILEKCDVKNYMSSIYCNLRKPSQLSESGVLHFYVEKEQESVLQKYVSQPAPVHVQQQEEFSEDVEAKKRTAEEMLKSAVWNDRFAGYKAQIIGDEFRWYCTEGTLIVDIKGNFIFVFSHQNGMDKILLNFYPIGADQDKRELLVKDFHGKKKRFSLIKDTSSGKFEVTETIKIDTEVEMEVIQQPVPVQKAQEKEESTKITTIPWYLKGVAFVGCFLLIYLWQKKI